MKKAFALILKNEKNSAQLNCFARESSGTVSARIQIVSMSRQILRTSVTTAITLALLFYGVAWAVLRCPHQEGHLDYEVALYDASSEAVDMPFSSPDQSQEDLDCMGLAYHTESLAGPSASSELLRLTRDLASHANLMLAVRSVEPSAAQDLGLKALFDNGPITVSSIYLPRYLSLSVLRV